MPPPSIHGQTFGHGSSIPRERRTKITAKPAKPAITSSGIARASHQPAFTLRRVRRACRIQAVES